MGFADIRDQEVPLRLLRHVLASGRIPNGLLFWGPSGVGKRLTALELAKAINCAQRGGDACGKCISCRKVDSGNHPDVKLLAPSGRGRTIGVDAIDFINELASYRPFEGLWRMVILQDADRIGIPAQNHFLKTLEEPPSNTLFILLTEFPRVLLPTIRSRCQQVRFGALRPETILDLLARQRDLPPQSARAVAALSQGQMSRALDLVDTGKREIVLDVTRRLQAGDDPMAVTEMFAAHLRAQEDAIKSAVKEDLRADGADMTKEDLEELKRDQIALAESLIRRDVMEYLYLLKTWYRDALVFSTTADPRQLLNRDQERQFAACARDDWEEKLAAIEKAWLYIERNLNLERVIRDLFFTLAPATA